MSMMDVDHPPPSTGRTSNDGAGPSGVDRDPTSAIPATQTTHDMDDMVAETRVCDRIKLDVDTVEFER